MARIHVGLFEYLNVFKVFDPISTGVRTFNHAIFNHQTVNPASLSSLMGQALYEDGSPSW